jgi:predicted methyltransferase
MAFLAAVGISAGIFLNTQEATAQQNRPALSLRRKHEQMLGFIGIRPGIVAVDLSAGGGYTTEIVIRPAILTP